MNALELGSIAWKAICWILLILSIIRNSILYATNKGKVSNVDYRIFHQSERDRYPSFSICIEEESSFDANLAYAHNATAVGQYTDSFLNKLTSVFSNGRYFVSLENRKGVWWKYEIRKNDSLLELPDEAVVGNTSMYENPNIPNRFCITQNNSYAESRLLIKNYDILTLNKTTMNNSSNILKVYIHSHGQLSRNLHRHDYEYRFSEDKESSPSQVEMKVVYVSVSRLRDDAPMGCISNIMDEDRMRRDVVRGS